jgi:hypothetical protein
LGYLRRLQFVNATPSPAEVAARGVSITLTLTLSND